MSATTPLTPVTYTEYTHETFEPMQAQGASLLVVEDDPDIAEALKAALQSEGFEVTVARNGRVALQQLPHISKPSLILLDLMMPEMNGWDFAHELSKDDMYATIPIIVLSALNPSPADSIRLKEFVNKPIDLDVLLNLVKHHFFRGLYSETENGDY